MRNSTPIHSVYSDWVPPASARCLADLGDIHIIALVHREFGECPAIFSAFAGVSYRSLNTVFTGNAFIRRPPGFDGPQLNLECTSSASGFAGYISYFAICDPVVFSMATALLARAVRTRFLELARGQRGRWLLDSGHGQQR